MSDDPKSRAQLVEELEMLRQRISDLEQQRAFSKEDRLKLVVVDRAPFSLWACDKDFNIKLWSTNASKIYGIGQEEALGKNYLDLFVSIEERERSAADCVRVINEDYEQRNFLAYDLTAAGTGKALLTNCFRIWDEDEENYLQAEVALEISELAPIIEEHRALRELGITKRAERERLLLLEHLGRVTTLVSSSIFGREGPKQVFEGISNIVSEIIGDETASAIYLYDESKHELRNVSRV